MSGRANPRRATDHGATVQSGYYLIGLLSCRVTVSWATILELMSGRAAVRRDTVLSGYCLSGMCPHGSARRAIVRSDYCPGIFKTEEGCIF